MVICAGISIIQNKIETTDLNLIPQIHQPQLAASTQQTSGTHLEHHPRNFWEFRERTPHRGFYCRWMWATSFSFIFGYGSIPINTMFSGMNIHLPAILGFTRYQGFDPSPFWLKEVSPILLAWKTFWKIFQTPSLSKYTNQWISAVRDEIPEKMIQCGAP